jgi:hypothetical protein
MRDGLPRIEPTIERHPVELPTIVPPALERTAANGAPRPARRRRTKPREASG